jgi:hypothetical protein
MIRRIGNDFNWPDGLTAPAGGARDVGPVPSSGGPFRDAPVPFFFGNHQPEWNKTERFRSKMERPFVPAITGSHFPHDSVIKLFCHGPLPVTEASDQDCIKARPTQIVQPQPPLRFVKVRKALEAPSVKPSRKAFVNTVGSDSYLNHSQTLEIQSHSKSFKATNSFRLSSPEYLPVKPCAATRPSNSQSLKSPHLGISVPVGDVSREKIRPAIWISNHFVPQSFRLSEGIGRRRNATEGNFLTRPMHIDVENHSGTTNNTKDNYHFLTGFNRF